MYGPVHMLPRSSIESARSHTSPDNRSGTSDTQVIVSGRLLGRKNVSTTLYSLYKTVLQTYIRPLPFHGDLLQLCNQHVMSPA